MENSGKQNPESGFKSPPEHLPGQKSSGICFFRHVMMECMSEEDITKSKDHAEKEFDQEQTEIEAELAETFSQLSEVYWFRCFPMYCFSSDSPMCPMIRRFFFIEDEAYLKNLSRKRAFVCSQCSIVFGFLWESLPLHHLEDFFLCLLVGHSLCMKVKDQLIHERIRFGELRCVHS